MFIKQEEDYLEADDITNKIYNEHELHVKEEINEEECDYECKSESESEEDRDLLCRNFDGLMHCVHYKKWEFDKD